MTTMSTIETQGPDGHPVAVTFAIARTIRHDPFSARMVWGCLPLGWSIAAGMDGEYLIVGVDYADMTFDRVEHWGIRTGVRFEVVNVAEAIEFIRERSL